MIHVENDTLRTPDEILFVQYWNAICFQPPYANKFAPEVAGVAFYARDSDQSGVIAQSKANL